MLALENTHNTKSGIAIAPERLALAADAAHDVGLPVHLNGARLFHAAVAHGKPATEFTQCVESVMFDLAKLGWGFGSILASSTNFIRQARHVRKHFGGHMVTPVWLPRQRWM